MSRLEKDQSGIELMNSVKGEFVNLSEELTDDAVSIEDIDKFYKPSKELPAVKLKSRSL